MPTGASLIFFIGARCRRVGCEVAVDAGAYMYMHFSRREPTGKAMVRLFDVVRITYGRAEAFPSRTG